MKKKKILTIDEDGKVKTIEKSLSDKKKNMWEGLEYTSIGYYLVVPLVVSIAVGLALDKVFNKHFFILIGILFGTVSCFYNLWKFVKEIENKR